MRSSKSHGDLDPGNFRFNVQGLIHPASDMSASGTATAQTTLAVWTSGSSLSVHSMRMRMILVVIGRSRPGRLGFSGHLELAVACTVLATVRWQALPPNGTTDWAPEGVPPPGLPSGMSRAVGWVQAPLLTPAQVSRCKRQPLQVCEARRSLEPPYARMSRRWKTDQHKPKMAMRMPHSGWCLRVL